MVTIPDNIISYLHHFHRQGPRKLWRYLSYWRTRGGGCAQRSLRLVGPGLSWAVVWSAREVQGRCPRVCGEPPRTRCVERVHLQYEMGQHQVTNSPHCFHSKFPLLPFKLFAAPISFLAFMDHVVQHPSPDSAKCHLLFRRGNAPAGRDTVYFWGRRGS